MAFADTDPDGEPFINVTHRVGANRDWDDLLAVQAMLKLTYETYIPLKKGKPTKGPVSVTGKPAKDTPILIAPYQKVMMKRAKPQGDINPAVAKSLRALLNSTIFQLNNSSSMALVTLGEGDLIPYLIKNYPLLAPRLQAVMPSVVVPRSEWERPADVEY
jgi:hypothetical protein